MAAVCPFPTARDAVNTTVEILQVGIPIAKIGKLRIGRTHTHTQHTHTHMRDFVCYVL